ncbi:MAG: SDR family oxidoreductase [Pseudomonadota bacterium]
MDAARGVDLFSMAGRTVLVAGASGGIGAEAARGLSAAGAQVALGGRRAEALQALADALPGSFALPFDMVDDGAAEAAVEAVLARTGRLDALICAAAARDRRSLAEIEPEAFRALMEANLAAPFRLARAAAPRMAATGRGRIVMFTSLAGAFAMPGDIAYPASKAGLGGLVRALAVELGPQGVTVNGIAPGPVATEVNAPLAAKPEWQAMIRRSVPLQRWAGPAEMVGATLFLASDASSYMTGQILTVDGGASVRMFPMD